MPTQNREKPEPKIFVSLGPENTWFVSVDVPPKKDLPPYYLG